MVTMVYPEHRKVGEDTVIGWAKDELVNVYSRREHRSA